MSSRFGKGLLTSRVYRLGGGRVYVSEAYYVIWRYETPDCREQQRHSAPPHSEEMSQNLIEVFFKDK
jgi:hypothetical protein